MGSGTHRYRACAIEMSKELGKRAGRGKDFPGWGCVRQNWAGQGGIDVEHRK